MPLIRALSGLVVVDLSGCDLLLGARATMGPPVKGEPEAHWQLLQKRTFTRYINSKLKARGLSVTCTFYRRGENKVPGGGRY